jgi:SIR2-like domain
LQGELRFVIKQPILEVLSERHHASTYDPRYLQRLKDFVPEHGRLKVFTLNYDLCVEDACRDAGIELVTGFSHSEGKWSPSLFQGPSSGINLYKLHGSLNWSRLPLGDGRLRSARKCHEARESCDR